MPDTPTYHQAHRPYLEAVAEALTGAGLPVTDVMADGNEPRDGYVELDPSVTAARFDDDVLTLAWTEERGWFRGLETPDNGGRLEALYDSDVELVATPAEVVAWVQTVLEGTDRRRILNSARFRSSEKDDDEFEARLRAYWPGA